MADSLVLKGVKDVRKHKGTEMMLVHPKRGGNTHQIKEWWRNGKGTTYTGCTVFNVTTAVGTVKLALATGGAYIEDCDIRIDHDGLFNFSFYQINEVQRAALFTSDMKIIEHYIFPSIAGGKIVTVTPANAADRPSAAPPATTVDGVTVSGEAAPTDGTDEVYAAAATGDATPFTYSWSATGGNVSAGQGTTSATVSWTSAGAGSVTCVVGSSDANFDGSTATDTLNTTVAVLFSTLVSTADLSVAVTVADTGNGNKYQIDGIEQDAIFATAGATIHFDLSDASVSGHPFKIYTDDTKTTEVTVGISQQGTDLLFTPPIAGSFSYQCANHADMGGDITVS